MPKKLIVDKDICIGAGPCAYVNPEVFELVETEDGVKAIVKEGVNLDDYLEKIQEAIEACPVDAIFWEEDKNSDTE